MAVYEFAASGEGQYVFPTLFNWLYTVSFKESADYFLGNDILYNSSLVFEISFNRSPLTHNVPQKGTDPDVRDTILKILRQHLEEQGCNPLYFFVCFAEDRKEAARLSLFIKWYDLAAIDDWQLYTYQLYESTATIYFGMFLNANHPQYSMMPDEFEQFINNEKKVWKELLQR